VRGEAIKRVVPAFAIIATVVALGLAGCATTPGPGEGAAASSSRPPARGGERTPQGGEVVRPGPQTGEAVRGLLAQASRAARAGHLDTTDSLLERALRIEPRNPALWHYLARLRLRQGRFKEAKAMAAKSNSLAGDNRRLHSDNWRLIGHCDEQLGDAEAARAANARADALQGR